MGIDIHNAMQVLRIAELEGENQILKEQLLAVDLQRANQLWRRGKNRRFVE
jgi:hypothetical protein